MSVAEDFARCARLRMVELDWFRAGGVSGAQLIGYGARSVVVRINDRGPFIAGRAIDLSRGAARAIGLSGVGRVHLAILG